MRSWAPPALAGVAFSLPYVDAAAYLPTKPALSSPLKDPS